MIEDPVRNLIAERLEALDLDMKEVSVAIGHNHAYLQQFLRRGVPRELKESTRLKLAKILGVKEEALRHFRHISSDEIALSMDHSGESTRLDEPPFEGAVPQSTGWMGGGSTGEVITLHAGEMQVIEPVAAWWKIPDEALSGFGFRGVRQKHIVAWPMDGSSMEPTIQRTDIVFIDTRRTNPDPEGIFALDYGEGRTLKRIRVKRDGDDVRLVLVSDNSALFPPMEYSPDEVKIFGRYLFRFTAF